MSKLLSRFTLLLVCCTLFAVTATKAQQSSKHLYLVDAASKLPITGATVHNTNFSFATISDAVGKITLSQLNISDTVLTISCVGYKMQQIATQNIVDGSKIWLTPAIASLQDIVVNAAAQQGIFRTISDLDIHLRPINNSQEVLRIVPGLFIGQHAGGGKAEQIFLRGFDIDHGTDINITVDGLPVNMVSHAHGQGYADLHFVIPELIEKVDFNKGPYFADKGNFATAGYVAFKTRDYLQQNFIKAEAGQFGTYRGVLGVNLLNPTKSLVNNQSLYLAAEGSFTKGYFESPQNFNRINTLLKYHGQVSKNSVLTAFASAFTSKWDASGQVPDRAVADGSIGFYGAIDDTEGGKTSRYNASATLKTDLKNDFTLENQLFYSRYQFELFSNFTFFLDNPIDGDQIRQHEDRNILGYNGSLSKVHLIGNKRTYFKAGVQARYDKTENSELSYTKNRTTLLEPVMLGNIKELNTGLFAEEKIQLNPKTTVTIGARADYFYNQYQDALENNTAFAQSVILSPKLNINYRLNNTVQLYLYNGRGFHSNDTRVAVPQNGRNVVTPAYGTDLGAVIKLGKKAVVQTALWHLWLQQEFVYVGDAGVVEPGGRTRRMGIDASVRYELAKFLYADMDVNYTKPRALGVDKAEAYLPLAPILSSTGGLTFRKQEGLNGSLRYRLLGNRPANEDYSTTAKGYCIVDAAVNYTKPSWELGLTIQNLLNSKWKETQFDTESRLQNEADSVTEIHFTPGTPFFARLSFALFF